MSTDAPFDPCRQWLGLDAVDLGDVRRVLGVAPQERDPLAVVRAAESRLNLLRSISPGPFELARSGLIKRVEEAREKLLAEIAVAPPRSHPDASSRLTMPPPPSTLAPPARPEVWPAHMATAGAGSARWLPPPVPGAGGPPAVPKAESVHAGGQWQSGGGQEQIRIRKTIYRKQTPVLGSVLTLLALTAVAGGLVYYKLQVREKEKKAAAPSGRVVAQVNQPAIPKRLDRDEVRPPRQPNDDRAVSTSRPPSKTPPPKKDPRRPPQSDPDEAPLQMLDGAPTQPVKPRRPPEKPIKKEQEKEEAMQKEAMQDAPPKEMPVAAAIEESRGLNEPLAEVLKAMQRQEYDTVDRLLETVSRKATSDEARSRINGWRQLATYVKGFFDFRTKALAAVKAGDEFEVNGKKIGVVEVDDEKFIYRVAGVSKTCPPDKIPAGIVLAIVTQWFDNKPANDLYLGSYHLAKPESDPQRAREHLEKAEAGGADASALMPLLDDPVFANAAGS